eukprot:6022812-Prymnesium_polylepis.2
MLDRDDLLNGPGVGTFLQREAARYAAQHDGRCAGACREGALFVIRGAQPAQAGMSAGGGLATVQILRLVWAMASWLHAMWLSSVRGPVRATP